MTNEQDINGTVAETRNRADHVIQFLVIMAVLWMMIHVAFHPEALPYAQFGMEL